ncbi:MAG TPA: hypothetical protein VHB21_07405, partial [Minicystis sp.]|nr:hypothetical protein [Minicystis sp.]
LAAPRVVVVDDGVRVHREAAAPPEAAEILARPGEPLRLAAFRDETVAFQVVVQSDASREADVHVDVEGLPQGGDAPRVERFVEHYVTVSSRSHDGRHPQSSIGWTSPHARPDDARALGGIPDALVPLASAPSWAPYPLDVPPHETRAVWVDVFVPRGATPGVAKGAIVIRQGSREVARVPLELDVRGARLPYRAVSFLAYYGRAELEHRIGHGDAAERSLWQLLHAHHVDALAALNEPGDVERLRPMLDGSLFTPQAGYDGPGIAVQPAAAALGTYGHIGEPTPQHVAFVRDVVSKVPAGVADLVLYAADEDCEEKTGPAWKKALTDAGIGRVRVLHSCNVDPRKQDVDVVMMTADGFLTDAAVAARARGKAVWVYNGALPRAGTLVLDGDLTSLRASAWIAASRPVGRWFLWETTFWDDDNGGGKGPVDPFSTAASFHNKHRDVALLDGLLVYPGDQKGFAAHALGYPGVLPSMRLQNLRRGVEDAGIYALARAAHPKEADAIVDAIVPAALDEIGEDARTPFPFEGSRWDAAREKLRALVPNGAAMSDDAAARVLAQGAALRHARQGRRHALLHHAVTGAGAAGALGVLLLGAVARTRRKKP